MAPHGFRIRCRGMEALPSRSPRLGRALGCPADFLAVSIAWAECSSSTGQTNGSDPADVGLLDVPVEAAPEVTSGSTVDMYLDDLAFLR